MNTIGKWAELSWAVLVWWSREGVAFGTGLRLYVLNLSCGGSEEQQEWSFTEPIPCCSCPRSLKQLVLSLCISLVICTCMWALLQASEGLEVNLSSGKSTGGSWIINPSRNLEGFIIQKFGRFPVVTGHSLALSTTKGRLIPDGLGRQESKVQP